MASAKQRPTTGLHPGWLVLIVALMCVGCPAYIWHTTILDNRADKGMRAVATPYLEAAVRGDTQAAYALLCDRLRRESRLATWSPTRQSPKLTAYRIVDTDVRRGSKAPTTYTVEVELTFDNGETETRRLSMDNDGGDYRVCDHNML
jgi:hypothetical protein